MKKRNLLTLVLMLLLSTSFILVGCGKTEEKEPRDRESQSNTVDEKIIDQDDEVDDTELMTEKTYKMHMKAFKGDTVEMEMVLQKDGDDLMAEYLIMPTGMETNGMKMKKMLVLDGKGAFVNFEIKGKNIWAKMGEVPMKEGIQNGINPNVLLKRLKEENAKKIEKEVRGENYDCYPQEGTEFCFDDDKLKYLLDSDGMLTEIVEYDNEVDSNVFKEPSDVVSEQEMQKMMIEAMGANLPAEETK